MEDLERPDPRTPKKSRRPVTAMGTARWRLIPARPSARNAPFARMPPSSRTKCAKMTKRRTDRKKKPAGSAKPNPLPAEPEVRTLAKETTPLTASPEEPSLPAPPAPTENVERAARSRTKFEAHKYSIGEEPTSIGPGPTSTPKHIPWSYGRDRVRALAVDPERLYVYWEVTDQARERARARLGAGDSAAWLNLRVYDTTGRLFDGTNAHGYVDHRVENGSRQRFFEIGKPGSEAFVEIGMKAAEDFVRIARSGRVVFPRRSPAPARKPQWLTVRSLAEPPLSPEGVARPGLEPDAPPSARPLSVSVAEHGGVSPVQVEPTGQTHAFRFGAFEVDGRTHEVLDPPWQVELRELGAVEHHEGSRVVSLWTVYRSWTVEGDGEPELEAAGKRMPGSSELLGGSEGRLRGASELRLGGASEVPHRGASERRLGGASERVHGAAWERRLPGQSGRR